MQLMCKCGNVESNIELLEGIPNAAANGSPFYHSAPIKVFMTTCLSVQSFVMLKAVPKCRASTCTCKLLSASALSFCIQCRTPEYMYYDVTHAISTILGIKQRHPIDAMKHTVCVHVHSYCCTNEITSFDSKNGTCCMYAVVCMGSIPQNGLKTCSLRDILVTLLQQICTYIFIVSFKLRLIFSMVIFVVAC